MSRDYPVVYPAKRFSVPPVPGWLILILLLASTAVVYMINQLFLYRLVPTLKQNARKATNKTEQNEQANKGQ
jgi:hypothetical protein